jgi:hypothetical protein
MSVFTTLWSGARDAVQGTMIRIFVLVSALAALVPAQATTVRRASLDDLIQTSTSIIRGRVVGSYAATRGSLIYTHYKVQVLDRWKGPAASQVDIQVPGGSYNGVRHNVAGAPEFAEGSICVFFLWTGPSGANHLLGLSQGVLDVTTDEDGNTLVVRQASEALALSPATGASGEQDTLRMKLSDFATRVAGALKGGDNTK